VAPSGEREEGGENSGMPVVNSENASKHPDALWAGLTTCPSVVLCSGYYLPLLQMRTFQAQGAETPAQGHPASKCQSWDSVPAPSGPKGSSPDSPFSTVMSESISAHPTGPRPILFPALPCYSSVSQAWLSSELVSSPGCSFREGGAGCGVEGMCTCTLSFLVDPPSPRGSPVTVVYKCMHYLSWAWNRH
jgi:hypothetical protein